MRRQVAQVLRKLAGGLDRPYPQGGNDISNDYVNWLCYANAGMLQRGNLFCFDYAIKNLRDVVINNPSYLFDKR